MLARTHRPHLVTLALLAPLVLVLGACPELDPEGPDPGSEGEGEGDPGGEGEGEGEGDPGSEPALESASAFFSGPLGADLRLEVSGADPDGDAAGLAVRILDASDAEVPIFDSDIDGFPDSGVGYLPFDAPIDAAAGESFDGYVVIAASLTGGFELARVEIAILDALGNNSASLVAEVQPQPVRGDGEGCDPSFVRDRCADGLGCKGTPATCRPGEAPALTRLAYLAPADAAVDGPRLLAEGSEPDNDLATLHLEFLDGDGLPVALDFDGDGVADASTFDADASSAAADGEFFLRLDLGLGVQDSVQRIAATPIDRGGRSGERVEADYATAVLRNLGQTCSPNGFDQCNVGAVCATGATGTSTCQSQSSARTQQCNAAPRLTLVDGQASLVGVADGTSLWDAPSGCSANDPTDRAEAVVQLRLDQAASVLSISTDTLSTTFDTTIYLVSPCAVSGEDAVACNDDSSTTVASTLELHDVPAGNYAIIVDSFGAGGTFGLEVRVE